MTFLSPFVLWLLCAISIPITIHILSNIRQNQVEFSSIRFIKELEKSSIRNIKLKKIILLLIRILFIVCLVLMMARPVTKAFMPGWLSAQQDSKLIVIIDNSASMSIKETSRSNLDISKNLAMSIMPLFNEKTKIVISQTCPPKIVFSGKSDDLELRNSIKKIKPSSSHDNIWLTMNNLLKGTVDEPIKECIVFSDLMYAPDSTFNKSKEVMDNWKFYFIQPEAVYDNLGLLNVSTINRIKTLNQLIKLNARVKNSGYLRKPNVPLELVFNDDRVGQVISEFNINKEKEFLFQAYPSEVGILEGKILLPDDDYNLDNTWYLTMPIMNQIKCSIISSSIDDVKILETILRSIDPESNFLNIEVKLHNGDGRLFFDDADVAILYNLKSIAKESVEDMDNFLKEGGGIIWFQGSSKKDQYHSNLFSKIGFPEIINKISAEESYFNSSISIKKSDLLEDIQVRNLNRELPEVYKYIKTKTNSKHQIYLMLSNNDPLLLEFSRGSGDIFYFSSLLDLNWNDFPIRGMVVPLLYRMIILSGTDEINTSPVLIDEQKWISIEESKLRNKWEVISPSGLRELIVPDYNLEKINIVNTSELGIYQVFSNGEKFTSFPTRLHYREYISRGISQKDVEKFIDNKDIRWLEIEENFPKIFSETRHGKSLWKIFLLIALILFLIETLLGKPEQIKMKTE